MVFKVKQKAVGDYNKHVLEQADNISMKISGIELTTPSNLRSKYRDLGIPIGSGYDGQPGAFYGGPGAAGGGGGNTAEEETGASGDAGELQPAQPRQQEYEVQYNWPYDYLSIVEGIKVDIEVLFDDESNTLQVFD